MAIHAIAAMRRNAAGGSLKSRYPYRATEIKKYRIERAMVSLTNGYRIGHKRADDSFGQARRIAFAFLRQTDDFLCDLNARTVSLAADMKELKEAAHNFKFARETPNDSEVQG